MAEKVEIVGGELDGAVLQNAASEATLLRLLAAVEKMGGGAGTAGGASASAKVQQLATAAQQANTTEVKKGTDKTKEANKSLEKFGQAVGQVSEKLTQFARNAFTGTLNALGGLTSELLLGGDRFSDFTKHLAGVPVVGGAFNALAGFLDKNIDMYRSLSEVGASFGNDLFEMRRAAAAAALPLDQFGSIVKNNSATLALFGDTTSEGAKRFGEVSKGLRTGRTGQALMAMGMTMQDVNEVLVGYMDIQSRLGRAQTLTNAQLAEEAGAFALELDKAARVTGMSRKELEKTIQMQQHDAAIRAMINRLGPAEQKKAMANFAMIEKQMPGLSGALKDLADGVAQTDEGQKLLTLGGQELVDAMQAAARGEIDSIELNNRMAALAPKMREAASAFGPEYIAALRKSMPGMAAVLDGLGDFNKLQVKDRQAIEAEQAKREKITSFLGAFEQTIAKIRGAIEESILKSAVFERVKALMGKFTDGTGSLLNKIADTIPKYIDMFLAKVEKFIQRVEEVGFEEAVKELFNKAMDGLKEGLGNILASAFTSLFTNPKVILALVAAIGVMGAAAGVKAAVAGRVAGALGGRAPVPGALGTAAGGAAGGVGAGVGKGAEAAGAGIGKGLEGLAKGTGALGTGVGSAIGGILKGIAGGLSALANPAALIGLGAVTLAVNGFAIALKIAGPALEPFGNMVKSAFEGIGTVVEKIGGVLSGTITSIANGIGTIVGKIAEYKTAGIEATTDQITKLSAIPSENMMKASLGITAMKTALEGFSPGLLSGISTGLGSMFGGDQADKINKLADAGLRLEPVGGYFSSVTTGLKTFENLNFETIDIGTAKLRALSSQVNVTADSFKRLEGSAFDKISDKIAGVVDSLKSVGGDITSSVKTAFGGDKTKSTEQLLTDLGSKVDRLNNSMSQLVNLQNTTADASKKTAKYTRQATGNLI